MPCMWCHFVYMMTHSTHVCSVVKLQSDCFTSCKTGCYLATYHVLTMAWRHCNHEHLVGIFPSSTQLKITMFWKKPEDRRSFFQNVVIFNRVFFNCVDDGKSSNKCSWFQEAVTLFFLNFLAVDTAATTIILLIIFVFSLCFSPSLIFYTEQVGLSCNRFWILFWRRLISVQAGTLACSGWSGF